MDDKTKRSIIIFEIIILILASIITGNILFTKYSGQKNSMISETVDSISVDIESILSDETAPNQIAFVAKTNDQNKPLTYRWEFGDGSTSNDQNPIHTFKKTGIYQTRLTVSDSSGNTGSDIITINIEETAPLKAKIGVNTWSGFEPLIVYFYGNTNNDPANVSYYWEFGPKNRMIVPMSNYQYSRGSFRRYFNNRQKCQYDSYEKNPIMVFCYEGLYWAKLTVTDENGNTDTDMVWIQVYDIDIHTTALNNIFSNNNT